MARKAPTRTRQRDMVQVKNPRSRRYVKIDRSAGVIVSTKKSPGPYKGVPIAARKGVDHLVGVDEVNMVASSQKMIVESPKMGVDHLVGVDEVDMVASGQKIIIHERAKKN